MSKKAEVVWKSLNGLIALYKPSDVSYYYVKNKILSNLCFELNNLETRPPHNYLDISETESDIVINVRPSYADNVLCVGPRYQPQDFEVTCPNNLSRRASGVVLLGINNGIVLAKAIKRCVFPKCYYVKGILGQATTNFYIDEKIIAKARYDKIEKYTIDKILAYYQAACQKKMFKENIFSIQNQEAYELAISGLYQPKNPSNPVIYGIKCIEFHPPNFTLEIHCTNEDDITLLEIVHNLGLSLKCFATCTGLRCVRYGCFTVEHALLKKHWKLEHILKNMDYCMKSLKQFLPNAIQQKSTNQLHAQLL